MDSPAQPPTPSTSPLLPPHQRVRRRDDAREPRHRRQGVQRVQRQHGGGQQHGARLRTSGHVGEVTARAVGGGGVGEGAEA